MLDNIFQGRVLVIAPHYDDESIGCGGILIKFRKQIERLAVVHMTAASRERLREFARVKRKLRVDAHYSLDYEDGFLMSSSREAVQSLIQIIQTERPDLLLTPHMNEEHSDHQAAACVTLDAAQKARYWDLPAPAIRHHTPALVEYEVWTALAQPSFVGDISDVFRRKCALINCYASQVREFPYVDYVTALNSWRGILYNRSGQAEAFCLRAI